MISLPYKEVLFLPSFGPMPTVGREDVLYIAPTSNYLYYFNGTSYIRVLMPDGVGTLTYNKAFITEAVANDGSFTETVVVTLTDNAFVADLTGIIGFANVPAGLTASFVRDSSTQITISLTGNATYHDPLDDTYFSILYSEIAFTSGIVTNPIGIISLKYIQTGIAISFMGKTFLESGLNDGTIGTNLLIALYNSNFVYPLSSYVTFSNVPAGLTANIEISTNSTFSTGIAIMTLTGTATAHTTADNVSNIGVEFLDGAFAEEPDSSAVPNYLTTDISVQYRNTALGTFKLLYNKNSLNYFDGVGTTDVLMIEIQGGLTFALDIADHIIITYPAGLTPVYQLNYPYKVLIISFSFTITGSLDPIDIEFTDDCFVQSVTPTDIQNYQKTITWNVDKAFLNWQMTQSIGVYYYNAMLTQTSGDNEFSTSDINLVPFAGEEFVSDLTGCYTVTGTIPDGYTFSVARINGTQARISITGSDETFYFADSPEITLTFLSTAFTSNGANIDRKSLTFMLYSTRCRVYADPNDIDFVYKFTDRWQRYYNRNKIFIEGGVFKSYKRNDYISGRHVLYASSTQIVLQQGTYNASEDIVEAGYAGDGIFTGTQPFTIDFNGTAEGWNHYNGYTFPLYTPIINGSYVESVDPDYSIISDTVESSYWDRWSAGTRPSVYNQLRFHTGIWLRHCEEDWESIPINDRMFYIHAKVVLRITKGDFSAACMSYFSIDVFGKTGLTIEYTWGAKEIPVYIDGYFKGDPGPNSTLSWSFADGATDESFALYLQTSDDINISGYLEA